MLDLSLLSLLSWQRERERMRWFRSHNKPPRKILGPISPRGPFFIHYTLKYWCHYFPLFPFVRIPSHFLLTPFLQGRTHAMSFIKLSSDWFSRLITIMSIMDQSDLSLLNHMMRWHDIMSLHNMMPPPPPPWPFVYIILAIYKHPIPNLSSSYQGYGKSPHSISYQ